MRPYKTILFIVAVYTMMGLIGYALPTEGVSIGSTTFEFPSPRDVMEGEEERTIQPLTDMDQVFFGMDAIKREIEAAQASEYEKLRRKVLAHKFAPSYPQEIHQTKNQLPIKCHLF